MSEQKRIERGMENVFDVDQPDKCICRVQLYVPSHKSLSIIVIHENQTHSHLNFSAVTYFEGTMGWRGANFSTASLEETQTFLKSKGIFRQSSKDQDKLYVIDTAESHVKIVAPLSFYAPQPEKFYRAKDLQDNQLLERITIRNGVPQILKSELREANGYSKEMRYGSTVEQILERFESGDRYEDILTLFPWLDSEDIQAALIYARRAISKPSGTE